MNDDVDVRDVPLRTRGWVQGGSDGAPAVASTADALRHFAGHWDDLELDTFMKDGGRYRYRRYGHFSYRDGELTALPHGTYHQSTQVNPLNGGVERSFAPLTEAFLVDPVMQTVVQTIGRVVSEAEGVTDWDVKLHPFRIVTSQGETGRPAPQGRHRDGCAFVTTVMVGRHNVEGGETSVFDAGGRLLMATTLSAPGDYVTIDDRQVFHDVTDVRPVDAARSAHRDVLIVDFDRPEVAPGG